MGDALRAKDAFLQRAEPAVAPGAGFADAASIGAGSAPLLAEGWPERSACRSGATVQNADYRARRRTPRAIRPTVS